MNSLSQSMFALIFVISTAASGMTVKDIHTHLLGPDNIEEVRKIFKKPDIQPVMADFLVMQMKFSGVSSAVALSAAYWLGSQEAAQKENNYIASEAARYPDQIFAFCSVNVAWDWALDEATRCITELKVSGMKLHFEYNKTNLNDPLTLQKVSLLFALLEKHKVPTLIHPEFGNPDSALTLFQLTQKYAGTNFIIAHAFGDDFRIIRTLVGLLETWGGPRNLYLDISFTVSDYLGSPDTAQMLWLFRKFGIDRVLFGSDFPFFLTSPTPIPYNQRIKDVMDFGFTAEELEALMYKNFDGLFN